ncbi:MAG: MGMT family protein [Bryobacterales bacterium]|nr:MGMT family protein [Bryobacterales bacterium]
MPASHHVLLANHFLTHSAPRYQVRFPATLKLVAKRGNPPTAQVLRRIQKARPSAERDAAIRHIILQIPRGYVATYGQVAAAAGYPLYHRHVARVLHNSGEALPWQRVVGAGGEIKLRGDAGREQRLRLEMEGVRFSGSRIVMKDHQHQFRQWEFFD